MDLYTVAGLAGFGAYVAAYALLQFGVLSGESLIYTGANTLAAALVLISLIADFNLASALIQITWIVIGVVGVLLRSTSVRGISGVPHNHQPTMRIADQQTVRLTRR